MIKNKGFGKERFFHVLSTQYDVSKTESDRLFELIGQSMTDCLNDGETVRVFNVGTLKKVMSKSKVPSERIRFRQSKNYGKTDS